MKKRGPDDDDFQAQQKKWDEKLRRSGFRDIERGYDLAEIEGATTFDDDHAGHGPARTRRVILLGAAEDESDLPVLTLDAAQLESEALFGTASIASAPLAQAWARFSDGAHQLPDGRDKRLLLDVADAGCITAEILGHYRLGRQRARTIVARHARAVRVPVTGLLTPGRTRKRA